MQTQSQEAVALVTGAARGVGRGVAQAMGRLGMKVYVTDISTKAMPHPTLPGTVERTADEVTTLGGFGTAAAVDHSDAIAVGDLLSKIRASEPGIDLLVLNAFDGNRIPFAGAPFWKLDAQHWENMFSRGVRGHILTASAAADMVIAGRGLIVLTGCDMKSDAVLGNHLYYDLAMRAVSRLAAVMHHALVHYGVTVVAVSPGFTRTEAIVAAIGEGADAADPLDWPGRTIASLWQDAERGRFSGRSISVDELGKEYGLQKIAEPDVVW
ncbi:SDR family NAD(P)-dependent oxidoreductase [Corticibacterium sp. UT-5YL-CI-8]|nr:SDR family NAD(P)-dependent oxidoreductase [Tianweitania sp. UT-5YL-CI-8]